MDATQRLKDLAVSESGFLFDPHSGATYSLNATGRLVLDGLKRGDGLPALAAALRDAFEVGPLDDLERDLREFLSLAREQGWPIPDPDVGAP